MTHDAGYRWAVVALVSLGVILNYLSRNAFAVLAPTLEQSLRFGVREYSYVIGAFQLAYTLMQPVCGWVIDRLGARAGIALFALAWAAAGMAHAGAGGWRGLAVCRGLLGAGEASAIPGGMKAIAEWFPPAERSVGVGWFNVGSSLGAMLAPPLAIGLSLAFGWRSAFLVTGGLGAVWAALWFALYRPGPLARDAQPGSRGPGVLALISQRRFWALAIPRFFSEPAWQTFSFWIPLYLASERGWNLKQIALFAWAPFLAADLGGLAGGYLSPWLARRFRVGRLAGRQITMGLGALLMVAPGCVALAREPLLAMGLLCIGGFAHQMISVAINTLSADLFDVRALAGANGWIGSAGWLGGLLFSLVIGQIVGGTGYGPLFACLGLFDVLGAVALFLLMRGLAPALEHG